MLAPIKTLENLILLRIIGKNAETIESYDYNSLVELRDKVSLIASNRDRSQVLRFEEIRYFEDVGFLYEDNTDLIVFRLFSSIFLKIFEGVVKFGEELIKLLKSGYIIIKDLEASFFCSPKEKLTVKIHFGAANDSDYLFGRRISERSTVSSINMCTNFLKHMQKNWHEHMRVKRNVFDQLAFFRGDTIVILQTELAKINSNSVYGNKQIEREMSMLLYNLNQKVDIALLKKAMDHAHKITQEADRNKPFAFKVELKLAKFGYSRLAILTALSKVASKDFLDYEKFCRKFETEEIGNRLKRNIQNGDQNRYFKLKTPLNQYGFSSSEEVANKSSDYLDVQFYKLEDQFIDQFEKNFGHLVCIEFLGNVLKYVQDSIENPRPITRVCPAYLETKQPNLLLCPSDQIVSTVLGLYMNSWDQPLPNNDEIIFCTSRTTSEDLELFWTRALKSRAQKKEQKLYCLANAQAVPQDQALKAQDILDRLLNEYVNTEPSDKKPMILCVVCSDEGYAKSTIALTFSKYTRQLPSGPSDQSECTAKLREYIFSHFKSASRSVPISVEKDNLYARIIASDRAGCGKSEFINDLTRLAKDQVEYVCIPIKKRTLPFEEVFERLAATRKSLKPKILHLDIAHEVWYGVDSFLFELLVVNYFCDSNGIVFRRSEQDLYLIEMTPYTRETTEQQHGSEEHFCDKMVKSLNNKKSVHKILSVLPTLHCLTTSSVQSILGATITEELKNKIVSVNWIEVLLKTEAIQLSCQYLQLHQTTRNSDTIAQFKYSNNNPLTPKASLELLLMFAKEKRDDPTWRELTNFANFLSIQFKALEKWSAKQDESKVKIFKKFFVTLIIQMASELALPSRKISDQSVLRITSDSVVEFDMSQAEKENNWQMTSPILLFDPDGGNFKIFGMKIDDSKSRLINSVTSEVVLESDEESIITSKKDFKLTFSRQLFKVSDKKLSD